MQALTGREHNITQGGCRGNPRCKSHERFKRKTLYISYCGTVFMYTSGCSTEKLNLLDLLRKPPFVLLQWNSIYVLRITSLSYLERRSF